MNHCISTLSVVYISIQSGHLNYFEYIEVARQAEGTHAFISDMFLVLKATKRPASLCHTGSDRPRPHVETLDALIPEIR